MTRSVGRAVHQASALQAELGQAHQLIVQGQGLLARSLLLSLREAEPRQPEVHRLLAIEALECRDAARPSGHALPHAQALVTLTPHDAFALMLLGRAHKQAGNLPAATAAYRRAIARQPQLAQAHVSLGIALKAAGDLPAAMASYRRALVIAPNLSAAHANLGIALARLVDLTPGSLGGLGSVNQAALAALRQAVQANAHNVGARHNLGVALLQSGQWLGAADEFNAALALDSARLDSCLALHAALSKLHMHPGARACCERWLVANPPHIEVVNRLFTTLLTLDDLDAAQACGVQALALAADMPEVLHNLGHLGQRQFDVPGALLHLRRAAQLAPAYLPGWQTLLMCMNYVEDDQRAITAEHRRFGAFHAVPATATAGPAWAQTAPPLLRVGWLSGDFRRHSVAYFIEGLFEAHDRSRFEWLAYDTSPAGDDVTERLQGQVARWVSAEALSDDELAARIRADGVHILVDLAGHTAGGRPGVFARRPAPVQINYLGYPTHTGLPAVGWRVSDEIIDPVIDSVIDPGAEDTCSGETVLRMPAGMFCYRPDADLEVGPLPALRNGHITFGSFNNIAKMSPATLALWAGVLRAVPDSRLLLKARSLATVSLQKRLVAAFDALGVPAQQLRLEGWADDLGAHLAVYREVDIALDTTPYNGATTTCEALWMGVPVLSLAGATHVSRAGASILHAAGLDDWVVYSADEFQAKACTVAHADAWQALALLRQGLRERLRASPLLNAQRQVDDLQALFERAWQAHANASASAPATALA